MKRTSLFLFLVLLLLNPLASAEKRIKVSGYYKNFFIFLKLPHYTGEGADIRDKDLGSVINRLRLKMSFELTSELFLDFAYDLSPKIQDSRLFAEDVFNFGFKPPEYRLTDIRPRLYPGPGGMPESFGLYQNLDRIYLTAKLEFADFYIGRQAIAWGSGRVINPTDIIAPFAFSELDTEERRGVDALRIRIPLGMMDELDMGIVAGKNFDMGKNAFFIRGKIYEFQTDVSLLLIGFRRHLLFGLDLARALGEAGFWLEAAYVAPYLLGNPEVRESDNYFRASVGLDYNLNSKTYGFLEYHFSSAGSNNPEAYSGLFTTAAYRDGFVYFMGKHYLNIGSAYQLSALLSFTGLFILNCSDGSFMLSPLIEYNIAPNIYLSIGAYLGIGKNSEFVSAPVESQQILYASEFGAYPVWAFTSFKIYF